MAWLDDRLRDHPKVIRLSDRAFRHWVGALCWSSAHNTRGRVDEAVLALRVPKTVVAQLVEVGLWDEDEEGLWIHDWDAHNSRRDDKVAAKRSFDSRRQRLMRDPDLRAAVRERDGDHCRYCGREVNWSDRKGIAGATYDHVDPAGPNALENLVVCCRSCNSIKAGRTPDQAGIKLRPAARTESDLDHDQAQEPDPPRGRAPTRVAGARPNDHDHDQEEPLPEPEPSLGTTANGIGSGTGHGSDLELIGPETEDLLTKLRGGTP